MSQAIINFIAERMTLDRPWGGERHWFGGVTGVSSDAMIREALGGAPVSEYEYPSDLGDLGRCRFAYQRAPWSLRRRMRGRLADYRAHVLERIRRDDQVIRYDLVPYPSYYDDESEVEWP